MSSKIYKLLIVFVLCISYGCSKHGDEVERPQYEQLLLKLSLPKTYAINEDVVNELDVLFFDAAGKFIIKSVAQDAGSGSYIVTAPVANDMTVLVLANSRSSIESLAPIQGTTTIDNVESNLTYVVEGGDFNTTSTDIPMSAWLGSVDIEFGVAPSIPTIDLERSVAKVEVTLDNSVSNFTLDGIGVANCKKYCLIPRKWSSTAINYSLNTDLVDITCSNTSKLYIYEKDNMPGEESIWSKLIVKGTYNGEVYYYPIYFKDNQTYADIKRNYHYKFTIQKVSGAGYRDYDKAKNSKPINMTVSIKAWDTNSNIIVFDGQYYIELPAREFTFSNAQTIPVLTDTDASLWKVTLALSSDANPNFDGATNAVIDNSSFEVVWYSNSKSFSITPKTTVNSGTLTRYLFVTTGRINFYIKLNQVANVTNNDWGDGNSGDVKF